jgi:hypothetical protein
MWPCYLCIGRSSAAAASAVAINRAPSCTAETDFVPYTWLFVREHGVHAGPKDYFVVVVVVVVICG